MKKELATLYIRAVVNGGATGGALIAAGGNTALGVLKLGDGHIVEGCLHLTLGAVACGAGMHALECYYQDLDEIILNQNGS